MALQWDAARYSRAAPLSSTLYLFLTREALANGKPTFLLMSHACCRHWYPCYGSAKRNFGH